MPAIACRAKNYDEFLRFMAETAGGSSGLRLQLGLDVDWHGRSRAVGKAIGSVVVANFVLARRVSEKDLAQMAVDIALAVAGHPNLLQLSIHLRFNKFPSWFLETVCIGAAQNTVLERVILQDNDTIETISNNVLAPLLKKVPGIHLFGGACHKFQDVLVEHGELRYLGLTNRLNVTEMSRIVACNPHLNFLTLYPIFGADRDGMDLARAIAACCHLKELQLNIKGNWGPAALTCLVDISQRCPDLRALQLSLVGLTADPERVQALACLISHPGLTELGLYIQDGPLYSRMRGSVRLYKTHLWQHFTNLLQGNKFLEQVTFGCEFNDNFTPEEEHSLSDALKKNDVLLWLDVKGASQAHIARRERKLEQNRAFVKCLFSMASTSKASSSHPIPMLGSEHAHLLFSFLVPESRIRTLLDLHQVRPHEPLSDTARHEPPAAVMEQDCSPKTTGDMTCHNYIS